MITFVKCRREEKHWDTLAAIIDVGLRRRRLCTSNSNSVVTIVRVHCKRHRSERWVHCQDLSSIECLPLNRFDVDLGAEDVLPSFSGCRSAYRDEATFDSVRTNLKKHSRPSQAPRNRHGWRDVPLVWVNWLEKQRHRSNPRRASHSCRAARTQDRGPWHDDCSTMQHIRHRHRTDGLTALRFHQGWRQKSEPENCMNEMFDYWRMVVNTTMRYSRDYSSDSIAEDRMNVDVDDERHSRMVGESTEVENPERSDSTRREEAPLGFDFPIDRNHWRDLKCWEIDSIDPEGEERLKRGKSVRSSSVAGREEKTSLSIVCIRYTGHKQGYLPARNFRQDDDDDEGDEMTSDDRLRMCSYNV